MAETRILMNFNYYSRHDILIQNRALAISWQSLPTVEDIITLYKASKSNCFPAAGPFTGLLRAFRMFSERYCGLSIPLPLVSTGSINESMLIVYTAGVVKRDYPTKDLV